LSLIKIIFRKKEHILETKKEKQGIVDRVWKFLSSVSLAVIVFSIISLTSVVGTIIEQQAEPERNIKLLAKFVGDSLAPTAFKVLNSLGFTDMFSSWWFTGLLFLFAANLVICSIDRLPKILKVVKTPISPLSDEQFNAITSRQEVVIKGNAEKSESKINEALKKIGFSGHAVKEGDKVQICAEKGRYSRLGVYITHLSILLILIGAVVGMKFGFNGNLNLLEGTSSAVAYRNNGQEIPLGFELRCDDFDVSFYTDSDRPKEYKSWLTVVKNGKEVMKKEIEVNSPLTYDGITFYQASYGFEPNRNATFRFTITPQGGKSQDFSVKFGESFAVQGTNYTGVVADFSPALGVDPSGKLFTYAESMNNPAAFVEFSEAGKPKFRRWFLKRYPDTWKTPLGTVEFRDLWGVQYTGLQVRKDPGVWIVYLGCIVMALGLYIAFFMSHARIWIRLREEKNSTRLTIASSINKNRIAFGRTLERLIRELQDKA
jgi:cytochrome c biogenesis protein